MPVAHAKSNGGENAHLASPQIRRNLLGLMVWHVAAHDGQRGDGGRLNFFVPFFLS